MKAYFGAALSSAADRDVCADEQRPFAHPAQAVGLPFDVRRQAHAVVANDEQHAAVDVTSILLASAWRTTLVMLSCATR